jgi:hypothetical protein
MWLSERVEDNLKPKLALSVTMFSCGDFSAVCMLLTAPKSELNDRDEKLGSNCHKVERTQYVDRGRGLSTRNSR